MFFVSFTDVNFASPPRMFALALLSLKWLHTVLSPRDQLSWTGPCSPAGVLTCSQTLDFPSVGVCEAPQPSTKPPPTLSWHHWLCKQWLTDVKGGDNGSVCALFYKQHVWVKWCNHSSSSPSGAQHWCPGGKIWHVLQMLAGWSNHTTSDPLRTSLRELIEGVCRLFAKSNMSLGNVY